MVPWASEAEIGASSGHFPTPRPGEVLDLVFLDATRVGFLQGPC